METTTNKTVTVNGMTYSIVKAGKCWMDLRGPRGGEAMLIQNIHTGRWVLIVGNTRRPRVYAVESMEVA
ncbi:MAG: hypothetical protein PVSMB1_04920 [Gemmatimonadaceae bacterium]